MSKFELNQKVWVIPLKQAGIIEDIRRNKYEVKVQVEEEWITSDGDRVSAITYEGFITCMAHELIPWEEGMELLYE